MSRLSAYIYILYMGITTTRYAPDQLFLRPIVLTHGLAYKLRFPCSWVMIIPETP